MIKILENDLKDIKFQGQSIKRVMFKEQQIFPKDFLEGKVYNGFFNTETDTIHVEQMDVSIENEADGNYRVVFSRENRAVIYIFLYSKDTPDGQEIPCVKRSDGGNTDVYRAIWDNVNKIWLLIYDDASPEDYVGAILYKICRSYAEATLTPAEIQ